MASRLLICGGGVRNSGNAAKFFSSGAASPRLSGGKYGRSSGGLSLRGCGLRCPAHPPVPRVPAGLSGRRGSRTFIDACNAQKRDEAFGRESAEAGDAQMVRRILQAVLWAAEGLYILWLFLLPYAPGDPVWAISKATVEQVVGLSLNFFFILPLLNYGMAICSITSSLSSSMSEEDRAIFAKQRKLFYFEDPVISRDKEKLNVLVVGIHAIEAPVFHPMSEGLFNFVIGWTLMFAPLLFTDRRRDRYEGSLLILWGFQMFLTNTFLIPYMAIRLNDGERKLPLKKPHQFVSLMTRGAPVVGIIGGIICLISALWAVCGRLDGGYGDLTERLQFLGRYIGSERLAYAFVWDIILYSIFQPWLIGENLQNVKHSSVGVVGTSRFIPVVGLVSYLLFLEDNDIF